MHAMKFQCVHIACCFVQLHANPILESRQSSQVLANVVVGMFVSVFIHSR